MDINIEVTCLYDKFSSKVFLVSLVVVLLFFSFSLSKAQVQQINDISVSTNSDSFFYTVVGHNHTISFKVFWNQDINLGRPLQNATVVVQVLDKYNNKIDEIYEKTDNMGILSFNYSSQFANKLTFSATKVIQNEKEWSAVDDPTNKTGSLTSASIVVWWDTFQTSLVSTNTNTRGSATVAVNITHLLLPEEGLILPSGSTDIGETYLTKSVQKAHVRINGVEALNYGEPGIYQADVSVWFPTVYAFVEVSQKDWATTQTGFSIAHLSNEQVWVLSTVGIFFVFALIIILLVLKKRVINPLLIKRENYPFYGAFFLAIISILSFYWGIIGIDGYLHGFDWMLLGITGLLFSFLGIVGCFSMIRRKFFALSVISPIIPSLTNSLIIKSSLDLYHLPDPWLLLFISVFFSIASGCLVCNSEKIF